MSHNIPYNESFVHFHYHYRYYHYYHQHRCFFLFLWDLLYILWRDLRERQT